MEISTSKTKSLVAAKEPICCKLAMNDKIEQIMSFRYLGLELTSRQDRKEEINDQSGKNSRLPERCGMEQ